MNIFDLLTLKHPNIKPENSKVHLAVSNGSEHPIDQYCSGQFEAWQAWQSKKNFSREYVVSLVRLPGSNDRWLFAGVYEPVSVQPHPRVPTHWLYTTRPVSEVEDLAGRAIIQFANPNRQNVPYGESVAGSLKLSEIRAKPLSSKVFSSYLDTRLSKAELDLIVGKSDPEWSAPLSAVSGIYLITDKMTGRLYVGSASGTSTTGVSGIWARWTQYSADGHGGNLGLREVLEQHGPQYAENFQYSILEVLPPQTDAELVKQREGHWKRVLVSHEHGYNRNLEQDVRREM